MAIDSVQDAAASVVATEVQDEAPAEEVVKPGPVANISDIQTTANTAFGSDPVEFSQMLVGDPAAFMDSSMKLSDNVPTIDPKTAGTSIDASDSRFAMDRSGVNAGLTTGTASAVGSVDPRLAETYTARTSENDVQNAAMTGARGEVSDQAIIDAEQADMQGLATGVNRDGSRNFAGEALDEFASQNISTVIDTSTMSGKLLADSLGEFNYLDSKATLKGQLDIISKDFVDPVTGATKIPTWAAGTARAVSRIAAFKGMTGTAATTAMAQAIMEASIPVAQQDAQFFQTLTVTNLNNKQQQTINTANVLAKMEQVNLDARMTTAVENAKSFLAMDMANLDNDQQSRVVNTQARVQAILEDSKAVNTARLFAAESANEMNKFYDNLNASIDQFNVNQKNSMEQFNTGEANSIAEFNASLENSREQFYKDMQYNIDIANTKWRQNITLAETDMKFQAAATDVKNIVGISVEQLNQLWDRSDALLDYAWKSSETALERDSNLAIAKINAEANLTAAREQAGATRSAGKSAATGSIVGSVASVAVAFAF